MPNLSLLSLPLSLLMTGLALSCSQAESKSDQSSGSTSAVAAVSANSSAAADSSPAVGVDIRAPLFKLLEAGGTQSLTPLELTQLQQFAKDTNISGELTITAEQKASVVKLAGGGSTNGLGLSGDAAFDTAGLTFPVAAFQSFLSTLFWPQST